MYNTVIFDLDGTLLNTITDLKDSANHALSAYGYPQRSTDEIRSFVGNGIAKLIERALPAGTPSEEFEKVYTEFKKYYRIHCNDRTAPYSGIMELLEELKKMGIKCGIASNKVDSAVAELTGIYFKGYIQEAAGVAEGAPAKPDASMINGLIKKLGSRREDVLYVGDSQVDVMTAANAGLRLIAVSWGFRTEEELKKAGASDIIKHPLELLNYLNQTPAS